MNNLPSDIQPNASNDTQKERHEAIQREFSAGNSEKVIALADAALAHVHDDSEALFWKAAALYRQKKIKEAIPFASEATYENSFNVRYFALLSLLYLQNREAGSRAALATAKADL